MYIIDGYPGSLKMGWFIGYHVFSHKWEWDVVRCLPVIERAWYLVERSIFYMEDGIYEGVSIDHLRWLVSKGNGSIRESWIYYWRGWYGQAVKKLVCNCSLVVAPMYWWLIAVAVKHYWRSLEKLGGPSVTGGVAVTMKAWVAGRNSYEAVIEILLVRKGQLLFSCE